MLDKDDRMVNLHAANARKTAAAQHAVTRALQELVASTQSININTVAKAAGVSRGFIYSQPELREQIAIAAKRPKSKVRATGSTPNEVSLRSRLETALDTIAEVRSENQKLKQRIEKLTAQLLDQKDDD